ncbi:MAG TPA: DUF885 domain-containing protein, partial [Actinomycetota bacterium]
MDGFWEDLLVIEPLIGTEVGDERYDDRLADPSEEGLAARKATCERAMADAAAIDGSGLDTDLRTTIDVLEAAARRELDNVRFRMDRFDAVSHLSGPGQLLAVLATLQRADTPERLDRYVGRLSGLPAYLDAVGRVATEAATVGQTVPSLVADRSIAQVERLLSLRPEDSPGVMPVANDGDGRDRVVAVLRDDVWPAYQRYLDVLRAYRPHARDSIGLSALPNGDAMYASQILAYTTLPLEPQRVHDIGQDDLAKILDERQASAGRLGYPDAERAVAAHTASGRNTASSRQDMVRLAEDQVRRSWDAAPRYFGRLPGANCVVRQVEEFREKDTPDAFYYPPSMDGSRPGIYFINTSDLDKRPLHHIATTTYHEANPGHHFQLSIDQGFTERPPLRRFGGIMAGSAFIEGWGLYSERLADEMGLFLDEYERIGMLEAQAWRAVRLIVDSGIHALGWDRERSVQLMERAGIPRVSAEIEVDRYIAWPG